MYLSSDRELDRLQGCDKPLGPTLSSSHGSSPSRRAVRDCGSGRQQRSRGSTPSSSSGSAPRPWCTIHGRSGRVSILHVTFPAAEESGPLCRPGQLQHRCVRAQTHPSIRLCLHSDTLSSLQPGAAQRRGDKRAAAAAHGDTAPPHCLDMPRHGPAAVAHLTACALTHPCRST